jgi:acyl-CoA hydrolase
VALRIGENVATLAHDGSTLQMGIGALPDAALSHMHGLRDLGIWSEMISDGVLALERIGALDRSRTVTSTFLFGSTELYEWAHDNPRLVMRRTETVNDPARIAEHPLMLAINTAIQIDLYAQANASYVRGTIYSGYGGQPDFVGGALHSAQGQSVLALHSWHEKTATSSILPLLEVPATSFQHSVVVTENGIAPLFGRSQHAQARLLIEKAAHPKSRDSLTAAAKELGLWREE